MPFELDPDEVELEPDPVLVDAAPPEEPLPVEVELWLDVVVGCVEEPELEELEPQAATPRATRTSSPAARRRGDLVIVAFINRSLFDPGRIPDYDLDAVGPTLVPGR